MGFYKFNLITGRHAGKPAFINYREDHILKYVKLLSDSLLTFGVVFRNIPLFKILPPFRLEIPLKGTKP